MAKTSRLAPGTAMRSNLAPATPDISTVICTYNRSHLLRKSLLAFQNMASTDAAEIIVVDNNSTDDTRDVVLECKGILANVIPVTYVHEPVQGLSAARNTGISAARGGIIAFLDDDAIPSETWLTGMKTLFESHPEAVAAGGPIEPNFEIPRPDWLTKDFEGPYTILDFGEDVIEFPKNRWPFGASLAFRGEVLRKHRFAEHLGRKGDTLLSDEETWILRTLAAEGGKIYYVPDMRVKHFIPKQRLTRDWVRERYYYGGMSKAFAARGALQTAKLVFITILKLLYLYGKKFLPVMGDPFVDECRLRLCRGAFEGLKMKYGAGAAS